MNVAQFKQAVQKHSLKGIYIFVGPELFAASQAIAAAVQELLPESGSRDFNFIKLYGEAINPVVLASFVSGPPFMSEKRIAHLPAFEELPASLEEDVLNALQNCAKSTLVFIEFLYEKVNLDDKVKRIRDWVKANSKLVEAIECPALKPSEASGWVQQELRMRGIKFESGVPQDLVSRLGTDQRILAGEIEKLSLYMNPEEAYISRKDCAQVCSLTLEDNIYALLDPVGVRDLEGSLAVLRSLRLAGYPEQLFLYNLALQFRQVYLASFLREQGKSPAEIAKEMNIRFEFIVMRLLKQAQVYNRDELRLALRRIRNGDAAIKSGLREAKIETEMILFDLCTPGRLLKQQ